MRSREHEGARYRDCGLGERNTGLAEGIDDAYRQCGGQRDNSVRASTTISTCTCTHVAEHPVVSRCSRCFTALCKSCLRYAGFMFGRAVRSRENFSHLWDGVIAYWARSSQV